MDRKTGTGVDGHGGRERLTLNVMLRYALIQLPGILLLVLVLLLIHRYWIKIPLWLGLGIIGLSIAKDLVLLPLVWRSYTGGNPDVFAAMIGRRGVVTARLDPVGYVRVHGEYWRAEIPGNDGPVEAGRRIIVVGVRGLKLYVKTDT